MKKFCLFLFAVCCGIALPLRAQCTLDTKEDDSGREVFVLENEYIRAVITPSSSGRIAEFMLKKGERHCFPALEYKALELTEGVFVVSRSNFAGYEDWIWEEGSIKQYVVYQVRILKKSPEECSLSVRCRKGAGLLERVMTLRTGSAAMEIETILTGVPQKDIKKNTVSYWSHIMIDPDRTGDHNKVRLYLPTRKPEEKHQRSGTLMQQVPYDCIVSRMAVVMPESMSDMFLPAQPWRAYAVNGLLLGSITPLEELSPDGLFYNYIGLNKAGDLSLETVYGGRELPQGTKRFHHQTLLVREWTHPVDYLDKNAVISCEWSGKKKAILSIGGITILKNVTAEAELLDNGNPVEKIHFTPGTLAPEKEFAQELVFRKEVNDPHLRIIFRNGAGKVLTKADLLKRLNFPLK